MEIRHTPKGGDGMLDDQDDDMPSKEPPTPEEIAEFEKNVRQLIRFRSPFDKHMKDLDDMLSERERQVEKPGDK
jgi:cytochrome c peroxidase